MVLGDAFSKLESFYFKVHNLVSVYPKSIIVGQMTNYDFSCDGVSLSIS